MPKNDPLRLLTFHYFDADAEPSSQNDGIHADPDADQQHCYLYPVTVSKRK
jgi:hypothetical protein